MPSSGHRQVLLVVGMHRSGTSATAGLLAHLGARHAGNPMPAAATIPRATASPSLIVSLHDRLLAEAGSRLGRLGPPRPGAARRRGRRRPGGARRRVHRRVRHATRRFAVLKDPRICRFLPLWQAVLADLGAEAKAVLPLRHPLEVAGSLTRRDGVPEEEGLLLWLRHVLAAEAGTRTMPRAVLRYEAWSPTGAPPPTGSPPPSAWSGRCLRRPPPRRSRPFSAATCATMSPTRRRRCPSGWRRPGRRSWPSRPGTKRGALPRLDALRATLDAGDALIGAAARSRRRRAAEPARSDARLARAQQAIRALTAEDPAGRVVAAVAASALFEADWYAPQVPGLAGSGIDPARHYALFGPVLGLDPGPGFDAAWYLGKHPDVAAAGVNPLAHYEMHGRAEGRAMRPGSGQRS